MCFIVVSRDYRELGFLSELPEHSGPEISIGWHPDRSPEMHHVTLRRIAFHKIGNRYRKGVLPKGKNGTEFRVYIATGDTEALDTCDKFTRSYPIPLVATVDALDFDGGLHLLAIEDSGIFSGKPALNG